jgi:hypothetical protein
LGIVDDGERTIPIHCAHCGIPLTIVLEPRAGRPTLQIWKCPWCENHHRAMFDARIKRVMRRSNAPQR